MKSPAPAPLSFEVCVLAGGSSQRMGRDKSRVRLGPRTLLGQIRTAASEFSPVRIIRRDLKPQCGPLGGVHTALTASRAEVIIFLACDMPFISFDLLRRLAARMSSKNQAVFVAQAGRVGFPFALRKSVLPVVSGQLDQGEFSLQTLARILKAKIIHAPRAMTLELFNINTPADLAEARGRSLSNRHKASSVGSC